VLKAPTVGTVGLYFIFFLLTTHYSLNDVLAGPTSMTH